MTRHWRLIDPDGGTVVLSRLRLAVNPWTRLRGLMGTPPLQPDQGLWLEPCNSVHMIGMRYALDIVYVDRSGVIVRLVPHLRPWRLGPIVGSARAVVELADGGIDRLGLRLGQRLAYEAAVSVSVSP